MLMKASKILKVEVKGPQSQILPLRACLHREEMPPFPLALGFNAAIPPRSNCINHK